MLNGLLNAILGRNKQESQPSPSGMQFQDPTKAVGMVNNMPYNYGGDFIPAQWPQPQNESGAQPGSLRVQSSGGMQPSPRMAEDDYTPADSLENTGYFNPQTSLNGGFMHQGGFNPQTTLDGSIQQPVFAPSFQNTGQNAKLRVRR